MPIGGGQDVPVELGQGAASTAQVHVGRQEIYDRDLTVVAYELLFRNRADATAAALSGDTATSSVIVNTFAEFGLDTLVDGRLAFLNMTRAFLVGQLPLPIGPDGVVLEILETTELDEDIVAGVRRLAADGYAIALDDFAWRPGIEPVLEVAEYVKLDVLYGLDHVSDVMDRCGPYGVRFVAERVESRLVLEECHALGFELFQGYHLRRPQVVTLSGFTPHQANSLQLLGRLADPDVSVDEIDERVRLDATLSYRVLRIANSAGAGLTRRISSVREAVMLVGLARLRAWLVLIALADLTGCADERQSAVIVRARACELLAQRAGVRADSAFTVGLVHGLAELMGLGIDELTARLDLHESLVQAVSDPSSPLHRLLEAVLDHERGDVDALTTRGFEAFEVSRAYLDALGWSLQVCSAVTA
jgi:EAL and modified HD-GYP domain-containing signal transduction protein